MRTSIASFRMADRLSCRVRLNIEGVPVDLYCAGSVELLHVLVSMILAMANASRSQAQGWTAPERAFCLARTTRSTPRPKLEPLRRVRGAGKHGGGLLAAVRCRVSGCPSLEYYAQCFEG